MDKDYSECHNLAKAHRDKVIEMVGRWWAEAGKYQVLPIDGSALERLNVERPTIARPRDRFVFYPADRRSHLPPRPRPTTGPGVLRPTS